MDRLDHAGQTGLAKPPDREPAPDGLLGRLADDDRHAEALVSPSIRLDRLTGSPIGPYLAFHRLPAFPIMAVPE